MKKEEFVAQYLPLAQKVEAQTGVPASLILSQAALESNYGKSAPGNNFFGIKGSGTAGSQKLMTKEVVNGQTITVPSYFRRYNSPEEAFLDHANLIKNKSNYQRVMQAAQTGDAKQIAMAIGKSGYATDPKYGQKVYSTMQKLGLHEPQTNPYVVQNAPQQQTATQTVLNQPQPAPAPQPLAMNMRPQQPQPAQNGQNMLSQALTSVKNAVIPQAYAYEGPQYQPNTQQFVRPDTNQAQNSQFDPRITQSVANVGQQSSRSLGDIVRGANSNQGNQSQLNQNQPQFNQTSQQPQLGHSASPNMSTNPASQPRMSVSSQPMSVNRVQLPTQSYIVRPGDTLSSIAQKTLGSSNQWKSLGYAGDPRKLQVGTRLTIPRPA